MSHYYIFPVGDWSGDGHAFVAEFIIKGEASLAQVRDIHFNNDWIGELCAEYEDKYIEASIMQALPCPQLGYKFLEALADKFNLEKHESDNENVSDGYRLEMNYESLIELWVFLLNQFDNSLKLEVVSPPMSKYYKKYKGLGINQSLIEGSINFYGYDEKGRHLKTPGYGVWDDCDSNEFYLDCN